MLVGNFATLDESRIRFVPSLGGKSNTIYKKNIYKVIHQNGSKEVYINLNYLEPGLTLEQRRKVQLPLGIKNTGRYLRYSYGNEIITVPVFFDAARSLSDPEINQAIKEFKTKCTSAPIFIATGVATAFAGVILNTTFFAKSNGHFDDSFYAGSTIGATLITGGITSAAFGAAQDKLRRKIRQEKIIDRYNSLLLQP